jgi:hypothetical protein
MEKARAFAAFLAHFNQSYELDDATTTHSSLL